MGNKRPVPTLIDKLNTSEVRPKVIRACEDLIEAEVASKSGIAGLAVKAAYKVVKALKPGIIAELVGHFLPEFAEALEPIHAESVEEASRTGEPLSRVLAQRLEGNRTRAAEALLSVTDRRARSAKNRTLKRAYEKLRGSALSHVEAAVPGVARTVAPFV
jgi:hypothetical protein